MSGKGKPAAEGPRDARDFAIAIIRDVVWKRQALDGVLERIGADAGFRALAPADRGLVRALATAASRGLGLIRKVLSARLASGMPGDAGSFEPVMIAGVAQILFLDVPDYAAVNTSMDKLKADRRAERYAKLGNAVLRAIAREKDAILAAADPLRDNTPGWLAERWVATYGEETARAIAAAHLNEPPLDLSVKADAEGWAARLGGLVLPTGSVRLAGARGAIPDLDGFAEGGWWVQDAAAALPARLLAVRPGLRVLDLCAAPGGKTAQLAAAGAAVVAVDRSPQRMKRLSENLARLHLAAEVHAVDALSFTAEPFEAILLDAPCSATGTIRRHPDTAWNKTLADIASLTDLQAKLIDKAWGLLAPGGRLVYATCSLEPEEGERQISAFLAKSREARLIPIDDASVGNRGEMISQEGFLRALPHHLNEFGGCDGFFAAVLEKTRA